MATKREPNSRAQLEQRLVDVLQLGDVVLLQLDEEVVAPEDVVIPGQLAPGGIDIVLLDQARDLGRHAAGGGDQPLGMPGQEGMVDAGIIVEALQLGGAGDLQQVVVAGLVLGQQQQVGGLLVFLRIALAHAARRHVGLQPDDRLDPRGLGGVEELDHPEHGAVIGEGDGGHAHLGGALGQLLEVAEAIKQRVFGMDMQVDKRHKEIGLALSQD